MAFDLKYWNNGEPVLPDSGLGELKYWLNGEPYVYYGVTAIEHTQTCSDSITFTESLQNNIIKKKILSFTIIDSVLTSSLSYIKLDEIFAIIDTFAKQSSPSKTFSDILELIENLQSSYKLTEIEVISIVDAISSVSGSTQSLSDILSVVESHTSQVSILNQEILSMTDSSTSLVTFSRVMSDVLLLLDSLQLDQLKSFSDILTFIESLQVVTGSEKSLADTLFINEIYSQLTDKNIDDALDIIELFSKISDSKKILLDSLNIAEMTVLALMIEYSLTDLFNINEELIKIFNKYTSDSFELSSPESSLEREIDGKITDTLAIAESLLYQSGYFKNIAENFIFVESLVKIYDSKREFNEIINITEKFLKKENEIHFSDTFSISELFSKIVKSNLIFAESFNAIDVLSKKTDKQFQSNILFSELIDIDKDTRIDLTDVFSLIEILTKKRDISLLDTIVLVDLVTLLKIQQLARQKTTLLSTSKKTTVLSTSKKTTVLSK